MELSENKVHSEKNCQKNDIYDAECADITDGLVFRLRKSGMELISDEARHASDEGTEAA